MGVVTNGTNKYQACIDSCNRCAQARMECMQLCNNEPDAVDREKCIAKLNECISICQEAAEFMMMGSSHAVDLCKLCALICDECAHECEMFEDDHCKRCAEECNKCGIECQSM